MHRQCIKNGWVHTTSSIFAILQFFRKLELWCGQKIELINKEKKINTKERNKPSQGELIFLVYRLVWHLWDSWHLVKRKPPYSARIGSKFRRPTWSKQMSPLRQKHAFWCQRVNYYIHESNITTPVANSRQGPHRSSVSGRRRNLVSWHLREIKIFHGMHSFIT